MLHSLIPLDFVLPVQYKKQISCEMCFGTPGNVLQVSGSRPHQKRVKALVDFRAVGAEQLAFFKDEIIVVTATHDPHWWVGQIEGDPSRTGTFPVNYVHKITD
ncbi:Arf-GAP with SH3 domain, ANK repeat and PH domain-containing protein 1 [Liparis tanakae]|uniref:Arf-GAP with SH3 domain, ANK repeat and PH domain-containing protein 1 n=1 Tax=Liparis tanakae TaxID=230148 RepID=A0A4Z2FRH9_9TELE|nr:Arf-GAP with SH3 domain, ANK repeat and PH domain-containing protein 1 [Liparis tanakae]